MEDAPLIFPLILLFVILCGYLSLGEAAVSSVSEARARAWETKNSGWKKLVDWEIDHPQKVIITILVARNLFSVAASALFTLVLTSQWGSGAEVWATATMTVVMVLFADFLPKCLGLASGENNFTIVLPGLYVTSVIFKPVVVFLEKIIYQVGKFFHVDMRLKSTFVTRDEIGRLVESGEKSGAIEETEHRMIDGVIALDETRVSEIMVPRTEVAAFAPSRTISGVLEQMRNPKLLHSRVPVIKDSLDDIVGVVYLKDMIPYLREGKLETPLTAFMRKPLFVPETARVDDLFNTMKKRHVHFAVVVDEYGGTAGIITLEDLLEKIVGEIHDEFESDASAPMVKLNDRSYKVKCTESLEDFANFIGYDFGCDEVDSVGGYVLDRFGDFPKKGEIFQDRDWTIEVTDVSPHRVNEVIFSRSNATNR